MSGADSATLSGTIVLAVPDFEPSVGGTNRHTALLARGLVARGRRVLVITRRRRRSWPRRETLAGVPVLRIGRPGWGRITEKQALASLALRLTALRRDAAAVCLVMWPDAGLAAAAAGVLRRTLVLWAIRGEADDALARSSSVVRRLVVSVRRATLRRAHHIALSGSMADELERNGLRGSIAVVPVPVDLTEFRPPTDPERASARRRLGLDGEFAVAYVGHLQRRKAVDRLVDAVATLAGEGRAVRLLVVGGGRGAPDDTEEELRAKVERERLGDVVRLCGIAADPRPYLWAADAFVLPSLREGMPNSLLEAMACGLPCVAPASAGGDELLHDGAGLVPDSNKPLALVDAIMRIADDADLRASLAASGRARAQEFGVDAVVERFEAACAEAARR